MLKKVLIIIVLFILSAFVYLFFGSLNLQSEFKNLIIEYIDNEEYTSAYEFHNSMYGEEKVYESNENGLIIHLYNAITQYEILIEDEDGEIESNYKIFEETLDLVLFNVSGNINCSKDSSIRITFAGLETVYEKELLSSDYALTVGKTFEFVPISIHQIDILEQLNVDVLPEVTLIEFYENASNEDSDDVLKFSIDKTFDAFPVSFFGNAQQFIDDYEYYVSGAFEESLESLELTDEELEDKLYDEEVRIIDALDNLMELGQYKTSQFNESEITSRTSYIVKNVILIGVILILNGVVVFFTLIKKRNKYTRAIVKMDTK